MKAVRQKNTGPEIGVRRVLHSMGYRYRLHDRSLPGTPDIVFPTRRKVILIHGCFWHGHDCPKGRLPKTRLEYWMPKIEANQDRDQRSVAALTDLGWDSLTVWQCQTKNLETITAQIVTFLGPAGPIQRPAIR